MEQTQANEKLSQWFNLAEQTPWEPGVYEVDVKNGFSEPTVSYWNGEYFCFTCAESNGYINAKQKGLIRGKTDCHLVKWRGLASDPSAKPKPKARGNRKVTRYVVTLFGDVVATYKNRRNAYLHANRNPSSRVQKLRFLSPEAD